MLESFLRANDELGLAAECIVLTPRPARFAEAAPHVAGHTAVTLHRGDVRSFDLTRPASAPTCSTWRRRPVPVCPRAPRSRRPSIGHRARSGASLLAHGARKLLLTSSGAVYGPQPPDCERLSEDYPARLRPKTSPRATRRASAPRSTCARSPRPRRGLEVKIARCFAFVGPLLPLDANFAIGNFIRDALDRDHIEVLATAPRVVRISTPRTSPSGCGPSWSGASRADRTTSGSEADLSIARPGPPGRGRRPAGDPDPDRSRAPVAGRRSRAIRPVDGPCAQRELDLRTASRRSTRLIRERREWHMTMTNRGSGHGTDRTCRVDTR